MLDIIGFERYLTGRKAGLTVVAYLETVRRLDRYLQERELMKSLADEFIYYLQETGCASKSLNRHVAAIRAYTGYTGQDIKMPGFRTQRKLPKWLSEIEQNKIIAACVTPLECAVIVTLLKSGIRRAELLSMKDDDIDTDVDAEGRGFLKVMGKGSKERRVSVPAPVLDVLSEWIKHRPVKSERLFPFHVSTVNRVVKEVANRAGVKAHPHCLRHSYASQFIANGGLLVDLQHQLGHTSLATTGIYTHVRPEDIRKRLPIV